MLAFMLLIEEDSKLLFLSLESPDPPSSTCYTLGVEILKGLIKGSFCWIIAVPGISSMELLRGSEEAAEGGNRDWWCWGWGAF